MYVTSVEMKSEDKSFSNGISHLKYKHSPPEFFGSAIEVQKGVDAPEKELGLFSLNRIDHHDTFFTSLSEIFRRLRNVNKSCAL